MSPGVHEFVSIDALPLIAGVLAAVTCALLGNFLVLRRMSLMGDAISHAVLPGLVVAFLLAGTRSASAMFLGAAVAGLVTVGLVELVRRLGRVEPGAAMGVVFSVLFALGVLLIERASAQQVDLDPDCVLHGSLETLYWFPPTTWGEFWSVRTFFEDPGVPRQVWTLVAACSATALFVVLCFKELRISSFDPGLATSQGVHAGVMHAVLMTFVAIAAVASFEAVGSILVIAMLICPAATARLLTDRLAAQIWASVGLAVIAGAGGYGLAAWGVQAMGLSGPVNAAGMMTVVSGGLLAGVCVFGPRYGVISRALRRRRLARTVQSEDLLGLLYRLHERGEREASLARIGEVWGDGAGTLRAAIRGAERAGLLVVEATGSLRLTRPGLDRAAELIGRHRRWEAWLVRSAHARADHVHPTAERLEHLAQPSPPEVSGGSDPHGSPIPGSRPARDDDI